MTDAQLAILVFVATYAIIVSERIHKTTAALVGAMVLVALKILDTEEAFEAIDLNVIFLLAGMMMIANTLAGTGAFQWAAVRAAKAAGGSPWGVLVVLAGSTAVLSALLDNVTTVVLIAPVALVVAQTMEVRVTPSLIAIVLASNVGGAATVIGDPPNIMIASQADIGFVTFLANVGPVALLTLIVFLIVAGIISRWKLHATPAQRERVMAMDESELITNPHVLRLSLIVLSLTILGFLLQGPLGYEPSTIALMGGSVLMLITRQDPHEVLRDIEWSTLFFFIGLFIVVAGLEKTGVLEDVATRAADATNGSPTIAAMLILWMSAILSGVIDNIPYTATMLPIVQELEADLTHDGEKHVLWWALAIGADFGGNLTIVGASANVLVASLAARAGSRISFLEFLLWGGLTTFGSMIIATAYLWLRYLAL